MTIYHPGYFILAMAGLIIVVGILAWISGYYRGIAVGIREETGEWRD